MANVYAADEQISLFDLISGGDFAVSCFDGRKTLVEPVTDFMKKLVPDGKFFVWVGGHQLVLRESKAGRSSIQKGHEFYHYEVGGKIYSGIFVGRDNG